MADGDDDFLEDDEELIGLSEDDVDQLQEMLAWYRQQQPVRATVTPELAGGRSAPDVYLAKLPDGTTKIDKLTSDTLGTELCDVYRLYQDDPDDPATVKIKKMLLDEDDDGSVYQVQVYNYRTEDFEPADEYFEIKRTKSGFWVPVQGGGGQLSVICKCTSEVGPRSGTTPGSGEAAIWEITDVEELEDALTTETIYNLDPNNSASANKYLIAVRTRGGKLVIVWEACPEDA